MRAGIDEPGHAVLQHEPGPRRSPRGMGMNVDETGNHQPAACVDALSRVTREAGLDGDDAAA